MAEAVSRRGVLAAAGLGVAGALGACGREISPGVWAGDGLMDTVAAVLLRDDPEEALRLGTAAEKVGVTAGPGLRDRSPAALERRRTAALRWRAQFAAVLARPQAVNPATAEALSAVSAHFALIADGAAFDFGRFDPLRGFAPHTLSHLDCAALTLPRFFERRCTVASIEEAQLYLARLEAAGPAIDQETQAAQREAGRGLLAPAASRDRLIAALRGQWGQDPALAAPVAAFAAKLQGLGIDPAKAQALTAKAADIYARTWRPALLRQAELLLRQAGAGDQGLAASPRARDYYAAAARYFTGGLAQIEDLAAIGRDRTAQAQAALETQLRLMGYAEGGVGDRIAAILRDPAQAFPPTPEGRAALLAAAEAARDRIAAGLSAVGFTQVPPGPRLTASPAEAGDVRLGASYTPAAGANPAAIELDLADTSLFPRADLATLMAHEAIPGHHLMFTRQQARMEGPLLARLVSFPAAVEGWGSYAEVLAEEAGLHQADPAARLGYLRWRAWRAVRVLVDAGLHLGGWTREQAIAAIQGLTGDSTALAAAEVDRYRVWPGQALSYEFGLMHLERLRAQAQSRLAGGFSLARFHEAVLTAGDAPPQAIARAAAGLGGAQS